MKFISVVLSVILALLSNLFPMLNSNNNTESKAYSALSESEYVENEVIVSYEELLETNGIDGKSFDDTLKDLGVVASEQLDSFSYDSDLVSTQSVTEASKEYIVCLLTITGDVLDTCNELEKLSNVRYAEPNYLYYPTLDMPTEVTKPTSEYTCQRWYFDKCEITSAWRENNTLGEGVTVAVIDTGFDTSAADFPTNLWSDEEGHIGYNSYNDTYNITPDHYHGTHVATTIAAPDDGSGIVGIAPKAQIMLIKASNGSESGTMSLSSVAKGVKYAVENGANVINLSLGGTDTSYYLSDQLTNAYNNNVVVLAAAGNDGISTTEQTFWPASFSTVIGVMNSYNSTYNDLNGSSNYDPTGTYYNITVPGTGILGSDLSTNGGGYRYATGTSMACAVASGIAALYYSVNPECTITDVWNAMTKSSATTARKVTSSDTYYYPFVKATEVLSYVEIPEITVSKIKILSSPASYEYMDGETIDWSVLQMEITYSDGTTATVTAEDEDVIINTTVAVSSNSSATSRMRIPITYKNKTAYVNIPVYPSVLQVEPYDSDATVDNEQKIIYGLDIGYEQVGIESYISLTSGGTGQLEMNSRGTYGTGSKYNIYYKGELNNSYDIVIFGDINGDNNITAMDAVLIKCYLSGLLSSFTNAQLMAADCNHDAVVDEKDIELIEEYAVKLAEIDQY